MIQFEDLDFYMNILKEIIFFLYYIQAFLYVILFLVVLISSFLFSIIYLIFSNFLLVYLDNTHKIKVTKLY